MNQEKFSELFRKTFAGALEQKLCCPRSVSLCPYNDNFRQAMRGPRVAIRIDGKLPLWQHGETGETIVGVTIFILPEWLAKLPIVLTNAPFLRRERDWHVPAGNVLCYSQDAEWTWKLNELWDKGANADEIIELAASWCIRNVDSLVTRHLHGQRYGIKKWPKEWSQWSHDENGIRECELFIQTQRAA